MKQPYFIVVCGPTASGKTRLAVELAKVIGAEIISADSRQVYKGMDIGTGKDISEYGEGADRIPCHLIDIVDAEHVYTVHQFQQDFFRVYQDIWARHKPVILAGGTGLYIEAVLKKYEFSNVPENAELRNELMAIDKAELERRLSAADPVLHAKTDLNSKKRIVRALEIALSKDTFPSLPSLPEITLDPLVFGVTWDRNILRERINARLEQRLQQGMLDEVKRIMESGISRERFNLFGMEYKHGARYLDGQVDYVTMVRELQFDIHHLAKRQETWFRGMERRGTKVHWIPEADFTGVLEIINYQTATA